MSKTETGHRFGEIAVRLGFVRDEDLARALAIQRERVARGMGHQLLGLILLEMGAVDTAQLIEILRQYETT